MDKAWLIFWWDGCDYPYNYMVSLNEQDALETFMSLIEEDMFETFCWMAQDEYEDINQDWEKIAQRLSICDTVWNVMEVPVIHGDACC